MLEAMPKEGGMSALENAARKMIGMEKAPVGEKEPAGGSGD
jgi:hypothetical protein